MDQAARSIRLYRDLGWGPGLARSLVACAEIAVGSGRREDAAVLLGAAEALREVDGIPLPTEEQKTLALHTAYLHVALGDAAARAAWERGRRMTRDEAVEFALSLVGAASGPS